LKIFIKYLFFFRSVLYFIRMFSQEAEILMRLNVYKKISGIAARIRHEILPDYGPGDRIPSERVIASILNESHNRVHRALQQLIEDGIVHSTGGQRGMFFTPLLSDVSRRIQSKVVLKFAIKSPENPLQQRIWVRICELFHMVEHSVEIQIITDEGDAEADIYLTWLPLCDCSRFKELDLEKISEVQKMIDGIIPAGVQFGKQYGLPILHAPGAYWAHKNMLKKCRLDVEQFRDPLDYYRWGKILEESGLCSFGSSYLGFSYHACHWGIEYKNDGNFFRMDPALVRSYFKDMEEFDKDTYHLENVAHGVRLFHRGQQGLLPAYLCSLPLTEKRFQLLGLPLHENGYACQLAYLLAMGKTTQHEDIVYDFFRFLLSDHIQELFFSPEVYFSVIDSVYRKQYQKICQETTVHIPPFDSRGLFSLIDPDIWCFIGKMLYDETADVLLQYKDRDKTIERICKINVTEQRKIWLETASASRLKMWGNMARYAAEQQKIIS